MRATEVRIASRVTERFVKEVCVTMQGHRRARHVRALADVFLRHRGDKRVQFELRVRRESRRGLVRAEVTQLRVRRTPTSSGRRTDRGRIGGAP